MERKEDNFSHVAFLRGIRDEFNAMYAKMTREELRAYFKERDEKSEVRAMCEARKHASMNA